MDIAKIFDEVIAEASTGKILVDDFYYNIGFNTSYNENQVFDNDLPVLVIRNKDKLVDLIKNYIHLLPVKSVFDIKKNIAFVWANATFEDFNNPEIYLQRRIDFINNRLFEDKEIGPFETLNNSKILIKTKLTIQDETPYCFESIIKDGVNEYDLPKINYGISGNNCYIYAVHNYNKIQDNVYEKKIKRLLYKLNENVLKNESDEYKNYKEGLDSYYPENISDVSPASILSLTIFLKELNEKNINNIIVVPFLPVRYQAKRMSNIKKASFRSDNEMERKNIIEQLESEQLQIQNNLTQKFLRNFYRLQFHFPLIKINSLPLESDENMHLFTSLEMVETPILKEIVQYQVKLKK